MQGDVSNARQMQETNNSQFDQKKYLREEEEEMEDWVGGTDSGRECFFFKSLLVPLRSVLRRPVPEPR